VARHIGILACSFEGAALCYRTIGLDAEPLMGTYDHPHITIDNVPMAAMLPYFERRDYDGLGSLMAESAERLRAAGATFGICPDNSCHLAFDRMQSLTTLPFLHIADEVARQIADGGYRCAGILGTRYTMSSSLYADALNRVGVAAISPEEDAQAYVQEAIFGELVKGVLRDETRRGFRAAIEGLAQLGCDCVVLGCTEIPLIVDPASSPLPTFDSTRILARAALRHALADGG